MKGAFEAPFLVPDLTYYFANTRLDNPAAAFLGWTDKTHCEFVR